MTPMRRVLGTLKKNELLAIAKSFDVEVTAKMNVDELFDAVGASKRATLDAVLPTLSLERLKAICVALNVSDSGNKKQALVDRILGAVDPHPANGAPPNKAQAWLAFPTLTPPAAPSVVTTAPPPAM